jgi:DNA-binding XRE family transcriptional regulator
MSDPEDLRFAAAFARQLKGWSQKDLARQAGLHKATVTRFENLDARGTSRRSEEAIRQALGFTPEGWLQWVGSIGRARREVAGRPTVSHLGRSSTDPFADLMPRLTARLEAALESLLAAAPTVAAS